MQVNDLGNILAGQRFVEHDLVKTVQELRTEGLFQQGLDLAPGERADLSVLVDPVQQILGTEVGGQNDDRVLEVHDTALRVGQSAVVQDLEQDVEDVGMGLLHLVKEDDGVGLAADGLGELAALLIADVAGRRSDQTGDAELLHVLGHIDADQILFVVKEVGGNGLCQLGLAYAGRPEEEEGTDRPLGILDPGAGALDGLGDDADGLVLSDDAAVQALIQVQELLAFALDQLGDGDTGPALDDLGDLLLRHAVAEQAFLLG